MSSGVLAFLFGWWLLVMAQAPPGSDCADWRSCQRDTEAAIAAGAFEQAHDLAWRAVQRGPRDDATLLFLLARAQCLSGRLGDALVMVRRLAERGVQTGAEGHPDLERLRALPEWAALAPVVAAARTPPALLPEPTLDAAAGRRRARGAPAAAPEAAPAASLPPSPPAPPPASASVAAAAAAPVAARVEDALRFSADPFQPGGLAYDAVSHRFLVGDRDGRKLRVAAEGLTAAVDLVREQSAGFHAIRAVAIDARRGDLWVASGDAQGAATLHKLQLISGRPLQAYPLAGEAPLQPVDLAVADSGAVLVLDADGRLLRLRPGTPTVETIARLDARARSLALAEGGEAAYVAHAGGVTRVDLASGAAAPIQADDPAALARVEGLRAHRGGLVAIQADGDGTRRVVRLELNGAGRRVRGQTRYDFGIDAAAGPIAAVVVDDDLAFVTAGAPVGDHAASFVVRRLRLR